MLKVKLFAWFREIAKAEEIEVDFTEGSVNELIEAIKKEKPELKEALDGGNFFVAVNREVASEESQVKEGDEVAIFPPVSGG